MSFRFSADRLDHFFALLPRDTEAAATLAEHRSEWLADRAWAKTRHRRESRHAIESRHQSFLDPAFVALMRKHRVALVFADSVAWPYAADVTADFVYLRLHGSEELYASGYSDDALNQFAARIKLWAEGRRQMTHAGPLPRSIHRSASRVMSMPISTPTRRSARRSRRGRCERGWRDYPVKPGKSRKKSESGPETARSHHQKAIATNYL